MDTTPIDDRTIPFGDDPFPKPSEYRILYEREITHSPPSKILNSIEGGRLFGRGVLDACCGTGRLSLEAKAAGAYPVGLDASLILPDDAELDAHKIPVLHRKMEDYLRSPDYEPFDIIACQNGIQYWLPSCSAVDIAQAVRPGGWLVFNLPVAPPAIEPQTEIWVGEDGNPRHETIWLDGQTVRRIIRCGRIFHRTSYPYLTDDQIKSILESKFRIRVTQDHDDETIFACQRIR